MMNEPERKTESSDEDRLVDEKFLHLNLEEPEAVKKVIRDHPEVISRFF